MHTDWKHFSADKQLTATNKIPIIRYRLQGKLESIIFMGKVNSKIENSAMLVFTSNIQDLNPKVSSIKTHENLINCSPPPDGSNWLVGILY